MMTHEQARVCFETNAWAILTLRQRAQFQLHEEKLVMPFRSFHQAMEYALDRPIGITECGLRADGLVAELDRSDGYHDRA